MRSKPLPAGRGVDMGLSLDSDGYLSVLDDWDQSVAHELAALESIQLTQDHWELRQRCGRW